MFVKPLALVTCDLLIIIHPYPKHISQGFTAPHAAGWAGNRAGDQVQTRPPTERSCRRCRSCRMSCDGLVVPVPSDAMVIGCGDSFLACVFLVRFNGNWTGPVVLVLMIECRFQAPWRVNAFDRSWQMPLGLQTQNLLKFLWTFCFLP